MFLSALLCTLTLTHTRTHIRTQTQIRENVYVFLYWMMERKRARASKWTYVRATPFCVHVCVVWVYVYVWHTNKRPSKRYLYRIKIRCLWPGPMQIHTLHIFCVVCYLLLSIEMLLGNLCTCVCVCKYVCMLLNIIYSLGHTVMAASLLAFRWFNLICLSFSCRKNFLSLFVIGQRCTICPYCALISTSHKHKYTRTHT